jgi:hypothetical protein
MDQAIADQGIGEESAAPDRGKPMMEMVRSDDGSREAALFWVRQQIANWMRWAEGYEHRWPVPRRYRSPAGAMVNSDFTRDVSPHHTPRPAADERAALAVHRGMQRVGVLHRSVLLLHYTGFWCDGERKIEVELHTERCRLMGVSRRGYYRQVERSELALKNILTWCHKPG